MSTPCLEVSLSSRYGGPVLCIINMAARGSIYNTPGGKVQTQPNEQSPHAITGFVHKLSDKVQDMHACPGRAFHHCCVHGVLHVVALHVLGMCTCHCTSSTPYSSATTQVATAVALAQVQGGGPGVRTHPPFLVKRLLEHGVRFVGFVIRFGFVAYVHTKEHTVILVNLLPV